MKTVCNQLRSHAFLTYPRKAFSGKVGSFNHYIWIGKQWFAERAVKNQYESREGTRPKFPCLSELLTMCGCRTEARMDNDPWPFTCHGRLHARHWPSLQGSTLQRTDRWTFRTTPQWKTHRLSDYHREWDRRQIEKWFSRQNYRHPSIDVVHTPMHCTRYPRTISDGAGTSDTRIGKFKCHHQRFLAS